MIRFPETVEREWRGVARVANVQREVKQNIERQAKIEWEVENLRVRHEARLLFQQELDAGQTPVLEEMSLTEYRLNPQQAPSDLIDGVMKENGTMLLMGPSGSGKTTMCVNIGHSLLTGAKFLEQPVKQIDGALGVVSYDMEAAMVFNWMDKMPGVDPDKLRVINAHGRGNPLNVPPMREQIVQRWRKLQVETVIIDSFSASFFGENQNDAAATMAHYRDLQLFALTEVGAKALIVIVHSTESSPYKVRGSTVHNDVADSILSVVANKSNEREVRMVKYRAATNQHAMMPAIVTEPDVVTHLVGLDPAAMSLAGMKIPAGVAFSTPTPHQPPDIGSTGDTDGDGDETESDSDVEAGTETGTEVDDDL